MPISRERMARYPGGSIRSQVWLAFRASLLERAGNRCEGTPTFPDCQAANGQAHPETGGHVVLTIAHMDHDETHADPARCRALCQRCHNAWDAPQRRANAAAKRQHSKDLEAGLRQAAESLRGRPKGLRGPFVVGDGKP